MSRHVTAMSLGDVELMRAGYRKVRAAAGLVGMRSRESVVARAGRHGSINRTRLRGDREIVLDMLFVDESEGSIDRCWGEYEAVAVAAADAVDTDSVLAYTLGDTLELCANVRLVELSAPVEVGANLIAAQLALRAADPRSYSTTLRSAGTVPLGDDGGAGGDDLPMPYSMPYSFRAMSGGRVATYNAGTVPTPCVVTLTGRVLDPIVSLDDERRLVFSGEVQAGETLVVDLADRTVRLGDGQDRRSMLRSALSRWFELPARREQQLTLMAAAWDATARMDVQWRDAYQ